VVRGLVIAIIVAFVWPKTWESTARLMPPDQPDSLGLGAALAMSSKLTDAAGGLGGGAASEMLGAIGAKTSGALFTGILRSRTVEDRITNKFDLRKIYRVKTYEAARKILEDRTNIAEDRKSGIITIVVGDRDPKRAADICQEYVVELNRLVAEVSTSSARRERIFLEDRLQEVKADLDVASRQLSDFSSKNSTLDITVQGKAMVDAAAGLQGELIATQSELRGLQAVYTDSNVRVRAVKARIDELRRQLDKIGGTPGQDFKNDSGSFAIPSLRELPVLGVTWTDLYRRAKIEETLYEALTKQYEMAKVEEAKEIPSVKVLDAPVIPEKRTSPKRLQVIFAGTMLGLLFGMGWVKGKSGWQDMHPHDARKLLVQEVMASMRSSISGPRSRFLVAAAPAMSLSRRNRDSSHGESNGDERDSS